MVAEDGHRFVIAVEISRNEDEIDIVFLAELGDDVCVTDEIRDGIDGRN